MASYFPVETDLLVFARGGGGFGKIICSDGWGVSKKRGRGRGGGYE